MVFLPQVTYFSSYMILAAVAIAGLFAGLVALLLARKRKSRDVWALCSAGVAAFAMLLTIVGLCPDLGAPPGGGVIVDTVGKIILVVNHAGFVGTHAHGLTVLPLRPGPTSVSGVFADISDNPKVRNINISVTFKPVWNAQAAVDRQAMISDRRDFETWAASALNQFNEAYSKELARLYDPNDPSQQLQFRNMVESFFLRENDPFRFGPPLVRGNAVTLENVKFYIVGSARVY